MIQLHDNYMVTRLQTMAIDYINSCIPWNRVKYIAQDSIKHLGVRGAYENLPRLLLKVILEIDNLKFEFFLSSDQLEYYIKNEKEKYVAKCNIEDFGTNEEMISLFKKTFEFSLDKFIFQKN
jgi:hypothetical protein